MKILTKHKPEAACAHPDHRPNYSQVLITKRKSGSTVAVATNGALLVSVPISGVSRKEIGRLADPKALRAARKAAKNEPEMSVDVSSSKGLPRLIEAWEKSEAKSARKKAVSVAFDPQLFAKAVAAIGVIQGQAIKLEFVPGREQYGEEASIRITTNRNDAVATLMPMRIDY